MNVAVVVGVDVCVAVSVGVSVGVAVSAGKGVAVAIPAQTVNELDRFCGLLGEREKSVELSLVS